MCKEYSVDIHWFDLRELSASQGLHPVAEEPGVRERTSQIVQLGAEMVACWVV